MSVGHWEDDARAPFHCFIFSTLLGLSVNYMMRGRQALSDLDIVLCNYVGSVVHMRMHRRQVITI